MKKSFLGIVLAMICIACVIYSQTFEKTDCSYYDVNKIESVNIARCIGWNDQLAKDEYEYNDFELNDENYLYLLDENENIIDNYSITWTSSDVNIVSVDQYGEIKAIGPGTAIITATLNNVTDTIKVTVPENPTTKNCRSTNSATTKDTVIKVTNVRLDRTYLSLIAGDMYTLVATITPSNATNKGVQWSSSNSSVAKVDANGTVTALRKGSATITVKTNDGNKTAKCSVTVTNPVKVTSVKLDKTSLSLQKGESATLFATVSPSNATDKTITWESSNEAVATVSSLGVVKGIAKGTANITVTTNDGNKTAKCKVTVTETIVKVTGVTLDRTTLTLDTNGYTYQLKATVSPYNATDKTVNWKSSNDKIATVSSSGVVKGISKGSATITVTTNDGNKKATCKVTVTDATVKVTRVALDRTTLSLEKGDTYTLKASVSPTNATDKTVNWKSSNDKIATVSSSGVVKAIAKGSATITVTTNDGNKTATCKVTVTENTVKVTGVTLDRTTLSLEKGDTYTLKATVSPYNATNKTITWKSSNTAVATVSSSGVVKGIKKGSVTITVTTNDGKKTAKCNVTITEPVKVTGVKLNKTSLSLQKGRTYYLFATVLPSNASDKTVNWKSSNTAVATVSSSGVVKGISKGSATITVTTNDGNKKATCKVTVK